MLFHNPLPHASPPFFFLLVCLCSSINLWGSFADFCFLGGSDSKKSACSEGHSGLISGSLRSHGERDGNPPLYSCLEKFMHRGAWWATVLGITESDKIETSTLYFRENICITHLWFFPVSWLFWNWAGPCGAFLGTKTPLCPPVSCLLEKGFSLRALPWLSKNRFQQLLIRKLRECRN